MEQAEIAHLVSTLSRKTLNVQDSIWKKAFAYYNSNNTKRLGMQCSGCYYKVIKYINESKG